MKRTKQRSKYKKSLFIVAFVTLLLIIDVVLISKNTELQNKISSVFKLPLAGGEYAKTVEDKSQVSSNQQTSSMSNEDYDIAPIAIKDITNFDWKQDVNESIGQITLEQDGKVVKMVGNRTNPGKNAIYMLPENHQEQQFAFDYDLDFGDSFISAGVFVKIKKEGNNLVGYMISFNKSGQPWYSDAGSKGGGIWTVTFPLGQNTDNTVTKALVKGLDLPQTGHMQINVTENEIKVEGTSISETIDVTGKDVGDGFGFFTVHYNHSCDQIGHFNLNNFATVVIDIVPHKLRVDPNGGEWKGSPAVQELEGVYKDQQQIPLPRREGYTFVKWTKEGIGGEMSTLTDEATYTWGEDESDDKITAQWVKTEISKQSDISSGKVTNGQKITYTLTAQNEGTVASTAVIKDQIPHGTTFVEGSIKIGGQQALKDGSTPYTQSDLESGIAVTVNPGVPTNLSFEVTVQDLENKATISNISHLKDTTVANRTYDKDSNQVNLQYVEPIISQTKDKQTENGNEYVIYKERITYKINVVNEGGLAKKVVITDKVPEETTFVEGSIKLNGQPIYKDGEAPYTQDDLESGITINVPEYTERNELTFDVTVNDLENLDKIDNIATVDEEQTNNVELEYREPIISQTKDKQTENGNEYVIYNERITYKINVVNEGGLAKDVTIVDKVPEGTAFVEGSIKLNGEAIYKDEEVPYTQDDLESGITISVPEYTEQNELTFDVTVNDLENLDKIDNIATVDGTETNNVELEYREPIISQSKDIQTEKENDYVIVKEKITYKINVVNEGGLAKDVTIVDKVPEGTTFVEESIKLNGEVLTKDNSSDDKDASEDVESTPSENETSDPNVYYTQEDLENGIVINVPEYTDKNELTFEVTVNDIEDSTLITNVATVDGTETNNVEIEYREPIISEQKAALTEQEQEYVVSNERITYTIKVENYGKLEKMCTIKDTIPKGTTFVKNSIKINDEPYEDYTEKDLKKGIEVLVPRRYVEELDNTEDENTEDENLDNENSPDSNEGQENEEPQESAEPQESDEPQESASPQESDESQIRASDLSEEEPQASENPKDDEDIQEEEESGDGETDPEGEKSDNDEEDSQDKEEVTPGVTTLSFDVTVDVLKDDKETKTITNVATVDEEETNEVKLEARPFNMKIDINVKDILQDSVSLGTQNKKLAKAEVHRKKVDTSSVIVTYDVTVTNTSKVSGTANLENTIPKGFKTASTNPSYWKTAGNNILKVETKELEPGETENLELALEWENGNSNFGKFEDTVKIAETENKSQAPETTIKDNESEASAVISLGTGLSKLQKQVIMISLASTTIFATGVALIKKYLMI